MGWSDIQQKHVRNREPNEYKREMEDKFLYLINLLMELRTE